LVVIPSTHIVSIDLENTLKQFEPITVKKPIETPTNEKENDAEDDADGSTRSVNSCRSDASSYYASDTDDALSSSRHRRRKSTKPKMKHSVSSVGLDEIDECRKEAGAITSNVVHIELPFGKPI